MDTITNYDVPKIDLEAVNKTIYEFYNAKAVVDNILTYKSYKKAESKEPRIIPLDIETAKSISNVNPKDLQYLKLYPSNIKNIMNPTTNSEGLSDVIINAINNDVLANSINRDSSKGGLNRKALARSFDFLSRLWSGKTLYADINQSSITGFDLETIMSTDANGKTVTSHIYDYALVNFSLNEKNELSLKPNSGLIGIKPDSVQEKELRTTLEKLKNGAALSKAEEVNLTFLSRVGNSIENIKESLNEKGEIVFSLSDLKETPNFKGAKNFEKGLNKLVEIGRRQEETAYTLKSGKKINLGEKQLIDSLNDQIKNNELLFGHNIQEFDIPAIVKQINSSEEAREYASQVGLNLSYLTNKENTLDTLALQNSLNQKQKALFYDILQPLRISSKEKIGQAEVLSRILTGFDKVSHSAETDVLKEGFTFIGQENNGKYTAKYLNAIIQALGVNNFNQLLDRLSPAGQDFLEQDFFDKTGDRLIMRMNQNGGVRTLNGKEGVFGLRSYGNAVAFTDGTILSSSLSGESGAIEYDSVMGKGLYQKDSIVMVSGIQEASREELEAISQLKGTEYKKLYKVGLMPLASKVKNDYSVEFLTEEELGNLFTQNTILAKQRDNETILSQIGEELLSDTYVTTPEGKTVSIKSLKENPLKALTEYSKNQEKRLVAEHSTRRLEADSVKSIIYGDEISRLVFNIKGKANPKVLGDLHKAVINAASNRNPKKRSYYLGKLQKAVDALGQKTELSSGQISQTFGGLNMATAEGWLKAFSIGKDNPVFNIGWFNNTMFYAQNMEPNSILASAVKKAGKTVDGKYVPPSQLVIDLLAQNLSSNASLNIPTRPYSYQDSLFLQLNSFGRKTRNKIRDNITKKFGIELDFSNRGSVEKNYQTILKTAGLTGEESLSAHRATVYNFVQDITNRKNKNPLFISEDKEIQKWLNDQRKWMSNNFDTSEDPLVAYHRIQNQIIDILDYRRKNGDFSFGVNPFSNSVNRYAPLLQSTNEEAERLIAEEINKITNPIYKNLYEYLDNSPETNFFSKTNIKKAYGKEAESRLILHNKQQRALSNYAYNIKELVEKNGGELLSTRDGRVFVKFAGEDAVRIDTMLPKLFQNGPASYIRLGGSNYLASFDTYLRTNASNPSKSYYEVVSQLESSAGRYFNKDADGNMLGYKILEESDDKGSALVGMLQKVNKDLREAGLQQNNPIYDADLNTGLKLEDYLTNDYKKKQLKEYIEALKKNGKTSEYSADIQNKLQVLSDWLEKKDNGNFVDHHIKNIFSELTINGVLPNSVRATIKTADEKGIIREFRNLINRGGKYSREDRSGYYFMLEATPTSTDFVNEIGRNIGRVEINTTRFAIKELARRAQDPSFSIAKKIAENTSLITHRRTFAALNEADAKTTSKLYARSLNATSADVDAIASDIEKYFVEKRGMSESMARRLADRFHLRTNTYEGGGSASGRWVLASGVGSEKKYRVVTSKNLLEDKRWNKANFLFETDKEGYITGFKYNRGYIVNRGENVISEFSDYLGAEGDNKTARTSVIRRRLIDNNGILVGEEDVLDFAKKSLKKDKIKLEDFNRLISNGDLREAAEIDPINMLLGKKYLGGFKEKHMLMTNIDTLKTAADIAEDIAKNEGIVSSNGYSSSLKALIENKNVKEIFKTIKEKADIDILENYNYDILADLASGQLNHEIWDVLGKKKAKARQMIIEVLEENKQIYSRTAKEELQNMFAIPDAVEVVTGGAHIISSEIEAAAKHKTDMLAEDTWLRLLKEKSADEAFAEYKDVFSKGMISHSGNTLIFNYNQNSEGYYDTKKIKELRRKYGWGDIVNGDYIDENGKLRNDLIGKNKYFVYDSLVSKIDDAENFDKAPKLGARELHALANNIVYADSLEKTKMGMAKVGLKPLFEELFGDINGTHLIWQEEGKRSGKTGLDLLLQNVATWNQDDVLYKPKENTYYERELKSAYEALMKEEVDGKQIFKNVPIGRKWLEDLFQSASGKEALYFEQQMQDTQNANYAETLDKVKKAFFNQTPDNLDANIVKVEEVNTNFDDILDYAKFNQEKTKNIDRGMIWGRNSIVELFSEDDEKMRNLLGINNRFIAVPLSNPRGIVEGSESNAFPEYQKAARRLFEKVVKYKENPTDELGKQIVEAKDVYVQSLKDSFNNKKSIFAADKISPRVQFGSRMKGQVRDYASVIKGRNIQELDNWMIENRYFSDLVKENNLPSFTIASIQDLEKFGYTEDYFEKQAKLFGYKDKEGVQLFKKKWLEEAKTYGVDAIVNRSPSDYQNSTVATKVFFTDSFGSGMMITDSITAAKMKLDSDGDHFYAAMLGVRSAIKGAEGSVLDTTIFNMYTRGGEDIDKIAELEQIYGKEAVAQIMDLRDIHRRAYMNDTFAINSGWLANASSMEKYAQFASSGYETVRQKKIWAAQEKFFEQYGVDGKMHKIQRTILSQAEATKAIKDWTSGWAAVEGLTNSIITNREDIENINQAAQEIMSSVANNADVFSFYNDSTTNDLYSFTEALRKHGSDYEKRVYSNIVLSNNTLQQENIREKLFGTSYDATRKTIEQGIKSKDKLIQVATQFALANHQQGVGEIDPSLFLVDVAKHIYTGKNKDGLTELERVALDYGRETLKEGFLSTKKGAATILEKADLASQIKTNYNELFLNIANNRGASEQQRILGNIKDLMLQYGFDATERFPQYKEVFKNHEEFVNTYIKALPKVMSAIPKEILKNPTTAANTYLAPALDKMFSSAKEMAGASSVFNRAQASILIDRGVMSGWKEQAMTYMESAFDDISSENRTSRINMMNAMGKILSRSKSKFTMDKMLQNMVLPRFDKWAKVGLGIVGAGFIGGNPSEPSGSEANKYARKPSSIPQPQYRDQTIAAPEYKRNQQGYIVNINARSPRNMTDSGISDRISRAITSTYSNNNVTINTNMHYKQDEISNSDLADYLASAL